MYILLIIAEIFSMVLAIEIYTISPYCRSLSTRDPGITVIFERNLIDTGFPGSVKANIKDYPYMGYINIGTTDRICACVFVTHQTVVTDLGCIEDRWFNRKRRLSTFHGLDALIPVHDIVGNYIKDYTPGGDRPNLAVAKMTFPTVLESSTDYLDIVRKYTGQWKLNQTCTMLGYGDAAGPFNWRKPFKSRYFLHKAHLNIVSISECEHLLKNTTVDREAYICAKHPQGKVRGCYSCIGIKHQKNEDNTSSLPYRFRVGRFDVYKGEIKLNKKLTTCKTFHLKVLPLSERVCFKNFKFTTTNLKKHGKVTQICLKLGFKNFGKTYEACGYFKGKKLVAKNLHTGTYEPQEMDTIQEDAIEEV